MTVKDIHDTITDILGDIDEAVFHNGQCYDSVNDALTLATSKLRALDLDLSTKPLTQAPVFDPNAKVAGRHSTEGSNL